jgi:predicted O-linked N-acetylglucosamine transferase (SPINDLY family)
MAQNNLANALVSAGQSGEGIEVYERLVQSKPGFAVAHMNLGNALGHTGHFDDVIAMYRRALEVKPDFADAHSNLIFVLDMMPSVGMGELQAERRRWDEVHAAPLWREPVHGNDRSPARRLRIGYVSADLRQHSASRTFVGILTQYDRTQFEVVAYSNHAGKGDAFTERLRQGVTLWRDIAHLSDEAVAQLIREDGIDILVDLSGHSAGNRLLVFARKPAPIQVTGWGYGSSTGMRAMDVFFTDRVLVPPEERHYFTEEVRYQASAWGCYTIDAFPPVSALPALSEGVLTFGSFNRLAKVSEQAYGAWAQVLLALPGSRLLLKTPELDDAANRERVLGHFTQAGVEAERIILQGKTDWNEHMQAYGRVDIALDPFPHGGGITTLEGLMMGVPVVTLCWPSIAGRLSASIVTVLGLSDWIAQTQEDYVRLAVQKAADVQGLAALRGRLRGIVSSVLGDQQAYVRSVEAEYRQLWQRWCASAPGRS